MRAVPAIRIREISHSDTDPEGDFVLYWMIMSRRTRWNFALERAVFWARKFGKPLLILEALRAGYPWAAGRFDDFIRDGMRDNAGRLADRDVAYYPYIEPTPGAGRGLLEAMAAHACVVVTDDYPAFFLPRMVASAGARIPVSLEAVDGNGLLPLRTALRSYPTAHSFRAFLQKTLPPHLDQFPRSDPLARVSLPKLERLPPGLRRKWPQVDLGDSPRGSAPSGGPVAGEKRLERFVGQTLARYDEDRNFPERDGTSGLSPYLHFGHVSSQQVFRAIARAERWSSERLGSDTRGKRSGWWGMSPSAEAFLDQLVTWRELGFNACHRNSEYDRYDSLPDWARQTLAEHAGDKREHLYSLERFENAATHDPLWNAAQVQLVREGRIHNYLRMLWGKKILEWSKSPQDALGIMIELNNKYALDGRDPNSYSGIFWVLGRYDRAWGPEREVFGKIRYMSSANTARKFPVREYIARFAT